MITFVAKTFQNVFQKLINIPGIFVSKYDYDSAAFETDEVNVPVVFIVHMVRKQIISFSSSLCVVGKADGVTCWTVSQRSEEWMHLDARRLCEGSCYHLHQVNFKPC